MPTLLQTLRLLISAAITEARGILVLTRPQAILYLQSLQALIFRGVLATFVIGGLGILIKWTPMIALGGIIGFLYLGILLLLAGPITILTLAALPDESKTTTATTSPEVTWKSLLSPALSAQAFRDARAEIVNQLRLGMTRYFNIASIVFVCEGLLFFFLAAFPNLRGIALVAILGAIPFAFSYRFQNGFGKPLRIITGITATIFAVMTFLPNLNVFAYMFGSGATPQEITLSEMGERVGVFEAWLIANWTRPLFIIALVISTVVGYVVFSRVVPVRDSSGGSKSWIKPALIGTLVALLVLWAMVTLFPGMRLASASSAPASSPAPVAPTPIVQQDLSKLPYGLAQVHELIDLRLEKGVMSDPVTPKSFQRMSVGPRHRMSRVNVYSNGVELATMGRIEMKGDVNAEWTFSAKRGPVDIWVALGVPPIPLTTNLTVATVR